MSIWLIIHNFRTRKAEKCFPELPPINTTHNYIIEYNFAYRCSNCSRTYVAIMFGTENNELFFIIIIEIFFIASIVIKIHLKKLLVIVEVLL